MAFASEAEVQTRLARTLSVEELAAAALLLDSVTVEIEQAASTEEADFGTRAAAIAKAIAIESVCRELASPVGAESTAESLGDYSYRVGYRETGGTLLTPAEELLIRRATGTSSGSVRLPGLLPDVYVTET